MSITAEQIIGFQIVFYLKCSYKWEEEKNLTFMVSLNITVYIPKIEETHIIGGLDWYVLECENNVSIDR